MRIERALDFLGELDLECGVVLKPQNIRYLTGFAPTSRALLLLKDPPLLLISDMDGALAKKISIDVKVIKSLKRTLKFNCSEIGIEKDTMPIGFHERYLTGKKVVDMDFLRAMRQVKDKEEMVYIKKAVDISDAVMGEAESIIAGGKTERQCAAEIEFLIKSWAKPAFDVILANGENSALPHHSPSNKTVDTNYPTIVDLGTRVNGYHTDMTRTFFNDSTKGFGEVYRIVLEAQIAGIKECYEGNELKNPDLAVRGVLEEYGLEKYFLHATGHGVGLEIHEPPNVGKRAKGKFKSGMVVTIEPGVYRDFGVRIEDLVLVGKRPKVLTKTRK
ncbi:aminopeptidase P family protein [archaeon]|nr:aminopeptidase P family protein [archaeon]